MADFTVSPVKGQDGFVITRDGRVFQQLEGYIRPDSRVIVSMNRKQEFLSVVMARQFLPDFDESLTVDHKDRDVSNNSLDNLRMATRSQQGQNRTKTKASCSSQYKGVSWSKQKGKWCSSIRISSKTPPHQHLGFFADEWDAAEAYNMAATEAFGEFACLNEKADARPEVEEALKVESFETRERSKETTKKWIENNREAHLERQKAYNATDKRKEAKAAAFADKHNCPCGGKYSRGTKPVHFRSKRHQAYEAAQSSASSPPSKNESIKFSEEDEPEPTPLPISSSTFVSTPSSTFVG